MAKKHPTRSAISRVLDAAGFTWSDHRRFDGYHIRRDASTAYIGWLPAVRPLSRPLPEEVERNKATALEMANKYAEALRAEGWPAEVIHLAGPLVHVTPKEARP
jgi:hypothetical protein